LNADFFRHGFYVADRKGRFLWGTFWGYFRCAWWGVNLGPGCRFHGRPYFRRYPGSRVTFGGNCTFLSSPNANLIGVNRPCLVSTMAPEAEIRVGKDCGFSGTVIAAFQQIILGQNVICGANTLITDSNWHPEDSRSGYPAPVIIEDNVWLGVNATVLKGVRIGENSVIGASSVVTRDIPANVIAAGNPCKSIRLLEPGALDFESPCRLPLARKTTNPSNR
jgi:acetyltransferase-like isoleucine patch superfamily enzyme